MNLIIKNNIGQRNLQTLSCYILFFLAIAQCRASIHRLKEAKNVLRTKKRFLKDND